MAVPKKRTSKSKTRSRKAQWYRKAHFASLKAISLGKSIATGNSNSFVFEVKKDTSKEE
jgi:large subunit ribosomal protein L32